MKRLTIILFLFLFIQCTTNSKSLIESETKDVVGKSTLDYDENMVLHDLNFSGEYRQGSLEQRIDDSTGIVFMFDTKKEELIKGEEVVGKNIKDTIFIYAPF